MLSYEASTIFFGSDFSGLLEWGCILRSSYSIKKFKRKQKHCKLQLGYVYKNRVENNNFFFFFWNSCSFILWTRKFSRKQSMQIQKIYFLFLIFPLCISSFAILALVHNIKEWEFQKKFCHCLPYSYTYPSCNHLLFGKMQKKSLQRKCDSSITIAWAVGTNFGRKNQIWIFFFSKIMYIYRPKRGNVIDVAGITSMTRVK